MKTDAQLKQDIEAELAWDPAINATAIGVSVKDGVVSLTGHIDTFAEKRAAEKVLRRLPGLALGPEQPVYQFGGGDYSFIASLPVTFSS